MTKDFMTKEKGFLFLIFFNETLCRYPFFFLFSEFKANLASVTFSLICDAINVILMKLMFFSYIIYVKDNSLLILPQKRWKYLFKFIYVK